MEIKNNNELVQYAFFLKGNCKKGIDMFRSMLANDTTAKQFCMSTGVTLLFGLQLDKNGGYIHDRNSKELLEILNSYGYDEMALLTFLSLRLKIDRFDSVEHLILDDNALNAMVNDKVAMSAVLSSEVALLTFLSLRLKIDRFDSVEHLILDDNALNAMVNDEVAMSAVAASEVAMSAVAASEVAMSAVLFSEVAMSAVAASEVAMSAVAASEVAMSAVLSSEVAMSAVAASEVALLTFLSLRLKIDRFDSVEHLILDDNVLNAMVNDKVAMSAVAASEVAMSAVAASEVAMSAVNNNMDNIIGMSIFTSSTKTLALGNGSLDKIAIPITLGRFYVVDSVYANDRATGDNGGSGPATVSDSGGFYSESNTISANKTSTSNVAYTKRIRFDIHYKSVLSGSYPNEVAQELRYTEYSLKP